MRADLANLFLQVAELSLQAVPVILALFVLRALLRKAPKVYSYALWSVVGFRLLCPAAPPSHWSLFNLSIFQRSSLKDTIALAEQTAQAGTKAVRQAAGVGQAVVSGTSVSDISPFPPAPAAPDAPIFTWSSAQVIALIWLAGIFCILLWNGVQLFRLHRRTRTAVRIEENVWESSQIPGPFLLGLLRPKIFLPTGLEGSARSCVLAHERYHLRRHDPWVKALAFLLRTIHWFNPAIWLAFWAMERDMELSCDEGALAHLAGDCRQDYSRTLLALGANRRDFGPALAFGTPAVKRRILHVLQLKKAGRVTVVLALGVLLLAGLTCCTSASTEGWVHLSNRGGYTYKMPSSAKSFAVYYEEQAEGHIVNRQVIVFGGVGTQRETDLLPAQGSFDIQINTDGSYTWTDSAGAVYNSTLPLETAGLFAQADSTGASYPVDRVPLPLDTPTELFTMSAEQEGTVTAQVTCYLYPSDQSLQELFDQLTGADYAKQLYEARVQYVGNNSAVGALRNVVAAGDFYQDCTIELYTGEAPYGLALHFTAPEGWTGSEEELALAEQEALRNGILMLALIDNAEYYSQSMAQGEDLPELVFSTLTLAQAQDLLGITDLKSYGQSAERVAQLLELIDLLEPAGQAAQHSYYLQTEADGAAIPCLTLERDGRFGFSYDVLSSYFPTGTWTESDGLVRCETDDGLYHYVFQRVDENTLQFVQDQSSSVEPIEREQFGVQIKDGDLFHTVTSD